MTCHRIDVEYDEKRCGWWFRGLGFAFLAYFTGDGDPFEDDFGNGFLEADVERDGEPGSVHISIRLPESWTMTADLFASAVLKQLRRFWWLPEAMVGEEAP